MKTDVIVVSSTGNGMGMALEQVEKVAAYKGLSRQSSIHLRLLTEEMMGMMRAITGETEGEFWIEDQDDIYQLHLAVETHLTSERRSQLLSASTSGKNESARTFMGWLRDVFDRSTDEDVAAYATPMTLAGMAEHTTGPLTEWDWSMMRYESQVQKGEIPRETWDELEKSVVAHVADDVKVSIRGFRTEMVILKRLT